MVLHGGFFQAVVSYFVWILFEKKPPVCNPPTTQQRRTGKDPEDRDSTVVIRLLE